MTEDTAVRWPLKGKYRVHRETDKQVGKAGYGGRASGHCSGGSGHSTPKSQGKMTGRALSGRSGSFRKAS